MRPTRLLRIWVTTTDIHGIWNSGSGTIRSEDVVAPERISFHMSGGGKIDMAVKTDEVQVSMPFTDHK